MDPVKKLTQGLLISGFLNILLACALFYLLFHEIPFKSYCEYKPTSHAERPIPLESTHTNAEVLRFYRSLAFEQLVVRLNNTQLVDNGYSQRSLALAALVAFHYFDLHRALSPHINELEERQIQIGQDRSGKPVEITIYPGITQEQYEKIIYFAQIEHWPLTTQGLYAKLRKGNTDPKLQDTFFLTPEFLAIETLFQRTASTVLKTELLRMICQGNWQLLKTFTQSQKVVQDLSPARRQGLLLDYITCRSQAAANLLLKTDEEFASRKLDDKQVLVLLEMLQEKSPEAMRFARNLLISPRNDAVRQKAAIRLFEFSEEPLPEKEIYQAALARFITPGSGLVSQRTGINTASLQTSQAQKTQPNQKPKEYVVQVGDSLWTISRRFKISIETLRKANHLESDLLRPGKVLRIP